MLGTKRRQDKMQIVTQKVLVQLNQRRWEAAMLSNIMNE